MRKPTIILSGGGTMGSVMPLVALWERVRGDFDCVWIGSRKGIERAYIDGLGIKYRAIPAGKIRRYFHPKTLLAPFFILAGFLASLYYLAVYRPKIVIVSGSFISVPLVWASWLLGVRRVVHQEDLEIGLAGKATIPFASAVTCAFPEILKEIKNKNKFWIGNPVREIFKNPDAKKWSGELLLVLVLGGGLGSEKINCAVAEIAPKLAGKARILHLTGKNKTPVVEPMDRLTTGQAVGPRRPYSGYERMAGMWDAELAGAMAAADIVVSRAGLSTLGEMSFLGKPAILIPLSGVGQDANAKYLEKRNAAVVVDKNNLADLENKLTELIQNEDKRKELSENIKKIFPPGAAEKLAEIIYSVLS